MTIIEMRKKRSETWEKAKNFLDTHRNASGILSAEDTATYERMEQEIVDLGHEIERQERLESMEREMQKATSQPIRSTPETKPDEKVGRASDAYKDAFWRSIRNENSYEIRNALREGVDSDGGYLVPDTFEHTLIQALDEENIIRQLAHTFTTASGTHAIPIVGTRGKATWVAEEQEIPETTETFTQKTISAHKLTALIKISTIPLSISNRTLLRSSLVRFPMQRKKRLSQEMALESRSEFCTTRKVQKSASQRQPLMRSQQTSLSTFIIRSALRIAREPCGS